LLRRSLIDQHVFTASLKEEEQINLDDGSSGCLRTRMEGEGDGGGWVAWDILLFVMRERRNRPQYNA
jgi:hypothetical protein